ncbi:MAG: transglycosylase domain-containing protein, partial [Alphaproteobacteria bacterium]|nr:transglycosylase domain-containing protein [Alphaproteobacteria bacterium]
VEGRLAERRPPVITLVADDGSRLTTYGGGHGDWLEIEEMSPLLPMAVMAIEDRRFYSHSGIDLIGLSRAMIANLRAGSIVQGGSTLTQQLAKNLFLTPERTIRRKVQEILLAFWLESRFTKTQILELYLNRVYLGGGAYGVDAAAQRYFGKSARDINLPEAALIAGLLKAPSRFAPTNDPAAGYARMNIVLDAMVDAGYLGPVGRGLAGRPPIVELQLEAGERYFTDWVMSRLSDLVGQPASDLTVYTTADPALQHLAQAELSRTLEDQGAAKGATQGAVVLMKEDGAVKALVGGADYRQSEYNRATNALRQPGSAFKLFVYLAAFEVGLNPGSKMRDSPFI